MMNRINFNVLVFFFFLAKFLCAGDYDFNQESLAASEFGRLFEEDFDLRHLKNSMSMSYREEVKSKSGKLSKASKGSETSTIVILPDEVNDGPMIYEAMEEVMEKKKDRSPKSSKGNSKDDESKTTSMIRSITPPADNVEKKSSSFGSTPTTPSSESSALESSSGKSFGLMIAFETLALLQMLVMIV